MSTDLESVKDSVRAYLRANCDPVTPKTQTSEKKHLEVWTTRQSRRPLGVEFGHADRLNIWVLTMYIPPALPATVSVAKKMPKGTKWTDAGGDGANSNLSGYDEFRTKPIARLGVTSLADAEVILRHLNR